jgi:glutathione S-transferase
MIRLHVKMPAPSVLKVLLFAAEAGREIETVEVSDAQSPEFLQMNPFGTVPVLDTGSGCISESLTICRYLDRLWGGTGLFGRSAGEELAIEQWERRAELMLFLPSVDYAHQTLPVFAKILPKQPQWAQLKAERSQRLLEVFERELWGRRFLAGDDFSMADITAYLGVSTFVGLGAFELPEESALRAWMGEISGRVSGRVLRSALERAGF